MNTNTEREIYKEIRKLYHLMAIKRVYNHPLHYIMFRIKAGKEYSLSWSELRRVLATRVIDWTNGEPHNYKKLCREIDVIEYKIGQLEKFKN